MKKTSIELYQDITHYITTEMGMYDELSKRDQYKKDRDLAKEKWNLLNETLIEIKKMFE